MSRRLDLYVTGWMGTWVGGRWEDELVGGGVLALVDVGWMDGWERQVNVRWVGRRWGGGCCVGTSVKWGTR